MTTNNHRAWLRNVLVAGAACALVAPALLACAAPAEETPSSEGAPPQGEEVDDGEPGTTSQAVVTGGACTKSGWVRIGCCSGRSHRYEYRWCSSAGRYHCFAPPGHPPPNGSDDDLCPKKCEWTNAFCW